MTKPMTKPMKAIPKREWVGDAHILTLYFPEMPANYGKICGWTPNEGHFEADMSYFWQLRPATSQPEIDRLLDKYTAQYDQDLVHARRDTNLDRQARWSRNTHRNPS
jgi:hypothetical protein